jgi:hypothetical protein
MAQRWGNRKEHQCLDIALMVHFVSVDDPAGDTWSNGIRYWLEFYYYQATLNDRKVIQPSLCYWRET